MLKIILDQEIIDICNEATTDYSALDRVKLVVANTDLPSDEDSPVRVNLHEKGMLNGAPLSWITGLRLKARKVLGGIQVLLEGVDNGTVHVETPYRSSELGEAA